MTAFVERRGVRRCRGAEDIVQGCTR